MIIIGGTRMETCDIVLICLAYIFSVALYILAIYATKYISSKWRILYLIPALVGMGCIAIFGFEASLLPVYLGLMIPMLGFFMDSVNVRKSTSIGTVVLATIAIVVCLVNPYYRAEDYVGDFEEVMADIERHYCLADHKNIDFDSLHDEYLPQFEDAYKNQDEALDIATWIKLSREFNDMHVNVTGTSNNINEAACDLLYGNDYGLSLMTLDNGKTVAVNVDNSSKAYDEGIVNGTEIVSWDGKSIEEQKKNIETTIMNFACKDNEKFYDAILVAGIGGDSVVVEFVDEAGDKKSVTLDKVAAYTKRAKETIDLLDSGAPLSNLEWKNVNSNTALLRLREMSYDSDTDASGDYEQLKGEISDSIIKQKDAGMKNLIIDLRQNGGGTSCVKVFAELLAPKGKHIYGYDGIFDTKTATYEKGDIPGTYKTGSCLEYEGTDLWAGGNIVILVNAETVSAADHFTKLFSEYPNVTIIGFTHSSCSAQGINGVKIGDYALMSYSAMLLLNSDGTVFIDTNKNGESTVDLDVQLAFDEAAVDAIFNKGEDYVLNKTVEYLDEN